MRCRLPFLSDRWRPRLTLHPAVVAISLGESNAYEDNERLALAFALSELVAALKEQERDSLDLVVTMIEGKHLRDIADLQVDLVS